MDFHNMKRKRLQSLCKKHGIPANLKNTEMAERLSLIFKEKDKSGSSQSGLDDSVMEKDTLLCNEDIIILDEEEETQANELKSNNTDNHQMVDSDTASGDANLHHGKLGSSHKRSAIPSSEENSIQDLVIEGSSAAVTKYVNPLLNDLGCDNHISAYDNVCEIEKRGLEVEQVDTMIHARSNSPKDSQNEVHSDTCNVSDEKRDQLLPSTPQIEVKSGSFNVHQVVASDTREAQGLSWQKKTPVADSEKCIGFSPELLEASVIKGMEPIAFLTPRISTCDMQHGIQSARTEITDRSHEVLHEEPNSFDIHDSNLMKISTEHYEYNLEERGDNNVGDCVHVHGDHCGPEVEMVSSDPSQLKISKKRSPGEDLEDSNALSPELLESSMIEGTETETKFTPRTTDILETCGGEKVIRSVKTQRVDNSQEALRTSPNAVVVKERNLWKDSSEEFSYSLLEGEVKKWSDNVDTCVIGKAEAENQAVANSLERSHCAKDTLEETSVICGFSLVEAQSSNHKDMDEAPTQFLLSMPQIEVNSCNSNIHDMNSSDTSQVKLSEKTSPVADSDLVLVNRTDDSFGKTSVTAGCSLHEIQFDSNNKDENPYQYPPAMSQTEVDFYNRNIHDMVHSEDTCQRKLLSQEKTSPVTESDESYGISPMLFKSSVAKTFEAKPNSAPKTPISFPKSSVTMEQVGNHQEVFHVAPDTLVINEANLLQVSTEECCHNLVVGDGTNFPDNGTENGVSESEKQADMLGVESVNMAKDAIENSNMTFGYCVNELQSDDSARCNDSDEAFMPEHASGIVKDFPENGVSESEKQADMLGVESVNMTEDAIGNCNMTFGYCVNELQSYDSASFKDSDEPFMPEHASDAASGDANAYQEKSQSSQKKSSVKNSEESIGFSPKLLESSMIQGFETASNLIGRTPRPRDIRGTFDMKENIQSVKKQVGTITSKKTSHKRQPLQDIQQN